MRAIEAVTAKGETSALCQSIGVSRASLYRRRRPTPPATPRRPRAPSPRALVPAERRAVRDTLHSARFVDQSPAEVYATLLEEQTYLCSPRTMYRVLAEADEVRERRDQVRHPAYVKPELVATAPNQVWSWDITKLKGPVPSLYYSLYVILDLFSRYVVGWMVAVTESAHLAERLIEQTCAKQRIQPQQLTIHADRGAPMRSKLVALLFSDLGIAASHSRPRVSNDNPFSEAQFRTFTYRPEFPKRFGALEHARAICHDLLAWYNDAHHHSGLSYLTPADVRDRRLRTVCVGKVRGPIVHEPPPPLEQVRPRVRRFDLVLDDMRQRRLDDLPRMVRLLGGPVPERRPEAVRHGCDSMVLEHLGQRRRGDRLPAAHGKHERIAVAERPRGVENLQRPPAQRDPVLALRLHPRSGNRPHTAGNVDLGPRRQPHLTGPRRGQHQKLERQRDRRRSRRRRAHRLDSRGRVLVGQRQPVRHDVVLRTEHRQDPVARVVNV